MASWQSAEDDPAARLTSYLRDGEQLLWLGRPDPAVRFSSADWYLVPFSIMWAGFALFWEMAVVAGGAGLFFMVWGIPFVAVGCYMTFGRFIVKARTKRRTAYGLTSERAIVAIGNTTLLDSPVKHVPTSIKRSRDGLHVSITFGNQTGWSNMASYANTGMDFFARGSAPVGFYDVADAEALLAALDKTRGG